MPTFAPSTDTYSNEYRLDCLAQHYLKTMSSSQIAMQLEKIRDGELKANMQVRLDYFRKAEKQTQEQQQHRQLPYHDGIKSLRNTLRSNLSQHRLFKK